MKWMILALVTLALCISASANPTADSASMTSVDGEAGRIAHLPVNITNVTNGPVQAVTFDLMYDHSILKLDCDNNDTLMGGDLTAGCNWTFILGSNERSITLATSNQSQTIQNGSSGSVVLLNFTVIGSAGETTPLELSDIWVSGPGGYDCDLGTIPAINGTFDVYKSGDVNSDGNITSVDAAIALRMAVRGECSKAADVSGDDRVTSLDALMILQVAADNVIL